MYSFALLSHRFQNNFQNLNLHRRLMADSGYIFIAAPWAP